MLHREVPDDITKSPMVLKAESQNPLRTLDQWEAKKVSWKNNMASIMGTLPPRDHLGNPDLIYGDSSVAENYTKHHITFASDERNEVTAFLYIPHTIKAKAPAMLVLHSTGDLGKKIVDDQGPRKTEGLPRNWHRGVMWSLLRITQVSVNKKTMIFLKMALNPAPYWQYGITCDLWMCLPIWHR